MKKRPDPLAGFRPVELPEDLRASVLVAARRAADRTPQATVPLFTRWDLGWVAMLIILALVAAGTVLFRTPERSLHTHGMIAMERPNPFAKKGVEAEIERMQALAKWEARHGD
jgi:hypothetical protein